MHPETEDLIEQIIRPLEANAELHLAARSYLLENPEKRAVIKATWPRL